jgi:histidyl-tRNA synthetase
MLSKIFAEINITDFTIHINDRRILYGIARQSGFKDEEIGSILISLDKYDKIGLDGVHDELITNGYDTEAVEKYLDIYRSAKENISCTEFCGDISEDCLPQEAVTGLNEIISGVTTMLPNGVKIVFDPTLVRGMGYYTGPIFEITMDGYNFSIAGGGRYDKMIGKFSGQDVSASGFSIGFERIVTILRDHMPEGYNENKDGIAYLIYKKASLNGKLEAFAKAKQDRLNGSTVTIQPMKKNLKRQIDILEAEGYTVFNKIYD